MLTLQLLEKMDKDPAFGEDCSLSFTCRNGSYTVMATVRKWCRGTPLISSELVLKLRFEIEALESRMAYCVNIESGSSLAVRLITKDGPRMDRKSHRHEPVWRIY